MWLENIQKRHLCQLIAHASLDLVEARARSTSNCFLKSVDRFNEWHISSFGSYFNSVHYKTFGDRDLQTI